MHKRTGFSLVEMLTVLAVLTILAGIVLPVIMHARQRQPQVSCLANLQQVHRGIAIYLTDYDGTYPPVTPTLLKSSDVIVETWNTLILPYSANRRVDRCPLLDNTAHSMKIAPLQYMTGYALNMRLNEPSYYGQQYYVAGCKESIVQYPPITVLVAEARIGMFGLAQADAVQQNVGNPGIYASYYLDFVLTQPPGAIRHNGGANYVFVDGHVEWIPPKHINSENRSDGVRPGFGL